MTIKAYKNPVTIHQYSSLMRCYTIRIDLFLFEFKVSAQPFGLDFQVTKSGDSDWVLTDKAALDFVFEYGVPYSDIPTKEQGVEFWTKRCDLRVLEKEIDKLADEFIRLESRFFRDKKQECDVEKKLYEIIENADKIRDELEALL